MLEQSKHSNTLY